MRDRRRLRAVAAAMVALAALAAPVSGDDHEPGVLRGTVTDEDGQPLAGVRVFVDGRDELALTDADGRYELRAVPRYGNVMFKRAGYRLAEVRIGRDMPSDVRMVPFAARALYAPAGVFATPGRLDDLLAMIERTEVNALVIDVKEADGRLLYATDLPLAREAGAIAEQPLLHLDELLPMLAERGIYTIARVVVMKDDTLAAARPELAIRDARSAGPWRDRLGDAWLDPMAPGVGEYAAAIARDLAQRGFDEVQLDYIRFPSDGAVAAAQMRLPNQQAFRLPAIARVLRLVSAAVATERAFLSADVFPISFILADDQGIGQGPGAVLPHVDYVSPMIYPSHYGPGLFGFTVPNDHPAEVTARTLELMAEHSAGLPVVARPWIQDFAHPPFGRYSAEQVAAQMAAAEEAGAAGWMIWNHAAAFTEAALGPPRDDEDAGPSRPARERGSTPAAAP